MTEQAKGREVKAPAAHVPADALLLCRMGARWSFTLNTRLGSLSRALANWSSVMHVNTRKLQGESLCLCESRSIFTFGNSLCVYLNLTVFWDDSVLTSCMIMEQCSRKVTSRLLGAAVVALSGQPEVVTGFEAASVPSLACCEPACPSATLDSTAPSGQLFGASVCRAWINWFIDFAPSSLDVGAGKPCWHRQMP